jgi:MIP family channel proteins
VSDRGGREGDPGWEPRRDPAYGRDYEREEGLLDEPRTGGRRTGASSGRGARGSGRGGVRRRGGRGSSGSRSGTGLYGSEIGTNMARSGVAELVGTAILIYAGTTVAVAASLEVQAIGTTLGSLAVPLTFGLALVALVAALGHVSGAHLNPAVTLSLAATRKFPWDRAPIYLGAQLLGAIIGSIATWITLGAGAREQAALASPGLTGGVTFLQGFFVEAAITFILVFVVISVATDERVADTVAPVAVGFALAVGVFIGGPVTGGSVNPARALGPIIVAWNNWDTALLYVLAPIVGGVLAAVLYDSFISKADTPG